MTEQTPLTYEQALRRADQLAADINYAEQAGLSEESLRLLREALARLEERAKEAGFGPLI